MEVPHFVLGKISWLVLELVDHLLSLDSQLARRITGPKQSRYLMKGLSRTSLSKAL